MLRISFTTLVILFLSVNSLLFAQEENLRKVFQNGKEFYIYQVEEGEGLYKISKKFNITQEELIQYNPSTTSGVKVGMNIRIPIVSYRKAMIEKSFNKAPSPKATTTNTPVNNDNFITHIVVKGETVYSLTKKYEVSSDDLYKNNPSLKDGLKVGAEILIPKKKAPTVSPMPTVKKETVMVAASRESSTYITHTVQPKETLYGISKKYGVTINSLNELNPEISNGLKIGQVIKVPIRPEPLPQVQPTKPIPQKSATTANKAPSTSAPIVPIKTSAVPLTTPSINAPNSSKTIEILKPTDMVVNVTVLMPFMLNQSNKQDRTIDKFVEFYEGVLLGIQTLKEEGLSVELATYDIEKSEEKVKKLLESNPNIQKSNLIIGPAYSMQVEALAEYSKKNNIPLIIPFTSRIDNIYNYPLLFQNNAPQQIQHKAAANAFATKFADKNIVIFNFNKDLEDDGSEFARALTHTLKDKNIAFQSVDFTQATFSSIANYFPTGKETILVLATDKYDLVKAVVGKVKQLNNPTLRPISIFGFSGWEKSLQEYPSTYYYSTFYIDRNRTEVALYRNKFKQEFGYPTTSNPRFDLMGYDIATYFIKAINLYGTEMPNKLNEYQQAYTLQSNFNFVQFKKGGYLNHGISIIHYKENEGFSVVE